MLSLPSRFRHKRRQFNSKRVQRKEFEEIKRVASAGCFYCLAESYFTFRTMLFLVSREADEGEREREVLYPL